MITISNVSKWYGTMQVLKNCSTEVTKGEVVVVCGPSGSGKSTLIKCVNGLEPFEEGTITVDGISVGDRKTDLPKLRARIGMVFQQFNLFPHLSVLRNLTIAQRTVLKRPQAQAEEQARAVLSRVGLLDKLHEYPSRLSGGQQQRVAIARALINEPAILLADEPTGNLDSTTSRDIMALFDTLNSAGHTIVVVTHEHDIAQHARRIITFRDGRVVEDERNEALAAA